MESLENLEDLEILDVFDKNELQNQVEVNRYTPKSFEDYIRIYLPYIAILIFFFGFLFFLINFVAYIKTHKRFQQIEKYSTIWLENSFLHKGSELTKLSIEEILSEEEREFSSKKPSENKKYKNLTEKKLNSKFREKLPKILQKNLAIEKKLYEEMVFQAKEFFSILVDEKKSLKNPFAYYLNILFSSLAGEMDLNLMNKLAINFLGILEEVSFQFSSFYFPSFFNSKDGNPINAKKLERILESKKSFKFDEEKFNYKFKDSKLIKVNYFIEISKLIIKMETIEKEEGMLIGFGDIATDFDKYEKKMFKYMNSIINKMNNKDNFFNSKMNIENDGFEFERLINFLTSKLKESITKNLTSKKIELIKKISANKFNFQNYISKSKEIEKLINLLSSEVNFLVNEFSSIERNNLKDEKFINEKFKKLNNLNSFLLISKFINKIFKFIPQIFYRKLLNFFIDNEREKRENFVEEFILKELDEFMNKNSSLMNNIKKFPSLENYFKMLENFMFFDEKKISRKLEKFMKGINYEKEKAFMKLGKIIPYMKKMIDLRYYSEEEDSIPIEFKNVVNFDPFRIMEFEMNEKELIMKELVNYKNYYLNLIRLTKFNYEKLGIDIQKNKSKLYEILRWAIVSKKDISTSKGESEEEKEKSSEQSSQKIEKSISKLRRKFFELNIKKFTLRSKISILKQILILEKFSEKDFFTFLNKYYIQANNEGKRIDKSKIETFDLFNLFLRFFLKTFKN